MYLELMYKEYEQDANYINDWKKMTKTQLANLYCDYDENGNTAMANHCFSGLMCKYWYMIPYLYNKNKNLKLDIEEYHSWIVESLMIGLKYRRWRDSNFAISKDVNGAEKVFNQCITSTRQRYYKYINQDKRKINLSTLSLDTPYQELNLETSSNIEGGDSQLDSLIDENANNWEKNQNCIEIVNHYLSKGDIISAIIIDGICFQDSWSSGYTNKNVDDHIERVRETYFSISYLTRYLKEINSASFKKYFNKTYKLSKKEDLNEVVSKLSESQNRTIHKYINKTLEKLRNSDFVRGILC